MEARSSEALLRLRCLSSRLRPPLCFRASLLPKNPRRNQLTKVCQLPHCAIHPLLSCLAHPHAHHSAAARRTDPAPPCTPGYRSVSSLETGHEGLVQLAAQLDRSRRTGGSIRRWYLPRMGRAGRARSSPTGPSGSRYHGPNRPASLSYMPREPLPSLSVLYSDGKADVRVWQVRR